MTSYVAWDATSAGPKAAAPVSSVQTEDRVFWSRIAHVAFFTCICLQRFGAHLGSSSLSVSVPVLFILAIVMIKKGRARIDIRSFTFFSTFAAIAGLSAVGATLWPDTRVGLSLLSGIDILLIYMMFCIRPCGNFDGAVVQNVFLFYARLCAVLGIVQFGMQFAGIMLYSFSDMLPALDPVLLEHDFAYDPLLSYESTIRRSNGFFLLEASIFSQLIAIAIVLDYFVLGRKKYLPLYAIAYMTSYSGTGLLSLAVTVALISVTSVRNLSLSLMLGVVGLLAGALFAILFPDQFAIFFARFGEIGSAGTSGTARYLSQFEMVRIFGDETRSLIGFGPGATTRSVYFTPGSGNPALQVFVDYGLIGAIVFFVYLINALWNTKAAALSLMLIINFELGGGYLLLTPYTLLLVALGVWASGSPARLPLAIPSPKHAFVGAT